MPTAQRPPIASLTSLRFLAALHVVFYHYAQPFVPEWAVSTVRAGPAAVGFFFVLSGFILTYNYGGAFEEGALTRRTFFLARFARIYPLYGALVLIELALLLGPLPVAPYMAWPATLAHLFMLQGFLRAYFHYGNVPGWSIGAEAFFYLLFPWMERAIRSDRRSVLLALMGLSWLVGMSIMVSAHWGGPPWLREWCSSAPIARAPEFAFGVCLGWLYRLDLSDGRRWQGDALVAPAAVSIAVLTANLDVVPEFVGQAGLLAPLYGLLIYGLAHGGRIALVLSRRPFLMLGELGFAIYLLQVPVFQASVLAGIAPTSGRGFAAYLVALIAVSFVVYFALERPLQRALRRGFLARIAARPDRARDAGWLAVPISIAALLSALQFGMLGRFSSPVLGAEPVEGVEEAGFHDTEWQAGRPFRWTNGTAWVRIPIGHPPSHVRVTIGAAPRPDTTIRIFFDGSLRFEGPLAGNGFSQALPLQDMRLNDHLRVTIESSAFRPREVDPSVRDERVLGVPLQRIELLY